MITVSCNSISVGRYAQVSLERAHHEMTIGQHIIYMWICARHNRSQLSVSMFFFSVLVFFTLVVRLRNCEKQSKCVRPQKNGKQVPLQTTTKKNRMECRNKKWTDYFFYGLGQRVVAPETWAIATGLLKQFQPTII